MSTFALHLQDATQHETVPEVSVLVGEDRTGQFGLMAHHERTIAVLAFSMARFRTAQGAWEYLALPGGLLYFADNECRVATSHYLRGNDRRTLSDALAAQLRQEEHALRGLKESLRNLEREIFLRIRRISHG
ncbi:MAG: F0F1 ATP synthase subunit epsilon [Candidatus Lambdaproteobacteria bacterium]|nr:F0F1 ATP synthase subunit epsilon [Candidatus Lambdaproteobacteria bacterium]